MKLSTRSAGLAALALTVSLGLAACGDDDSGDNNANDSSSSSSPSEMESDSMSASPTDDDAPFGEACALLPGAENGTLDQLEEKPVATAVADVADLSTLSTAIKAAGLEKTLNDAEELTVFAPTNEAFAQIPEKKLNALLADKEALTKVLTNHVVATEADPDEIAGDHKTMNGTVVTVAGSGTDWTVNDATVECGNIDTDNAKVYVIDSVLMP